ncbi:MAG: DNA translocase FtsK 4TM domain-containing protein, partial [Vicinamibacteria bacterium]
MANPSRTLWPELKGACLLGFALMLLLSFATYDPHDPTPWFSTGALGEPRNWIGRYGAFISELFVGQAFGIAAFVLPLGLLVAGWRLLWREELDAAVTKSVGLLALLLSLAAFAFIALKAVPFSGEPIRAGGAVGESIALFLAVRVGRFGAVVVLALSLFTGLILTTQFSFSAFLTHLVAWLSGRMTAARVSFEHWRETRRKDHLRQQVIRKHAARSHEEVGEDGMPFIDPAEARFIDLPLQDVADGPPPPAPSPAPSRPPAAARLEFDPAPEPGAYSIRPGQSMTPEGLPAGPFHRPFEDLDLRPTSSNDPEFDLEEDDRFPAPPPMATTPQPSVVPLQSSMIPDGKGPETRPAEAAAYDPPSRAALRRKREPLSPDVQNARSAVRRGRFALPPLSLLDPSVAASGFDRARLTERARVVEAKCKEFGVAGAIVEIHPGPVVTTYEFKPDAGVKYA